MKQQLQELSQQPESFWSGARYALTGTTAAIRDLRSVTRRDNIRIQILVVLAVLVVLLVVLQATRRLSVYDAHRAVQLLRHHRHHDAVLFRCLRRAYQGLDWKVPLFSVRDPGGRGQDYNVYLATRVFEEQARIGPFAGLRRAVVCTGGIITSCGVIMAGTFISMTSGTWGDLLPLLPERVAPTLWGPAEHRGDGVCAGLGRPARHVHGAADSGARVPGTALSLARRSSRELLTN